MSRKHMFDEDTKKETFVTPSDAAEDPKAADADFDDIEIVIDEVEVEEEEDRRASGPNPETD